MTEFYTIKQVADRLSVHPNTIIKAIKSGKLRSSRVGRLHRISEEDLLSFMGVTQKNLPEDEHTGGE